MFRIRGANSEEIEVESEELILVVTLSIHDGIENKENNSTINTAPYLFNELSAITVKRNEKFIYQLGYIIDGENDSVYLEDWSISSREQFDWVIFHNNTNQNSLSFELSPPSEIPSQTFTIDFTLTDNNKNSS